MAKDIIQDCIETTVEKLRQMGCVQLPKGSPQEQIALAALEGTLRGYWGGDAHYALKNGEYKQREMSERDRAIRRDFTRGARPELLSRRYGLTPRRILQIVQIDKQSQAPAEQTAAASVPRFGETACLTDFRAPGDAAQQRPTRAGSSKARAPTT